MILKRKREVNYRRGTTGRHCAVCDHFVDGHKIFTPLGDLLRDEPRCSVIGLGAGRAYRVGAKNLCDRFTNSRRLAAIVGMEARP